jgi:hypothetical protein
VGACPSRSNVVAVLGVDDGVALAGLTPGFTATAQRIHSFKRCEFEIQLILVSTRACSMLEQSPATLNANCPVA